MRAQPVAPTFPSAARHSAKGHRAGKPRARHLRDPTSMTPHVQLAEAGQLVLAPWRTNCRVTRLLVGAIPPSLWEQRVPGMPRKTIRMLAAHLHNARSRWLKVLGMPLGIVRPPLVNLRRVTRAELLVALKESDQAIEALLSCGIANGGEVPATAAYTWRNLPLDVGHVLSYFVAHEAHHRGQLVMAARLLGARLPPKVVNGLWQWQQGRRPEG
jgi:uncharacterized damage-inducible protein DinB